MKATGIVRRIDDLGRVVIPKEIRRTMRIREGDPLEIFTDRDGEVILKKYSPIGELGSFASQYADSLAKTSGFATLITDKDSVIAVAGVPKRELNKPVSPELERIMHEKATMLFNPGDAQGINVVGGEEKYKASVVCPIISEGDTIGSVVFVADEKSSPVGEVEAKLAQSAAGFLGRQIED